MSTVWRYTAMILAGAAILLAAGLYSLRTAWAGSRPSGLSEARKVLTQLGGEPGLAARKAQLSEILARLQQERRAHGSDAAAFSRRIEEVCAGLGLELASSSEWKPVAKFKASGSAAFERTFTGSGPFDRLLDALATIESWPDAARIHNLSITRQEPGRVAFTFEVTAVRTKEHGKGDDKAPPLWQSYLLPEERDTPPRPVAQEAQARRNPFDRQQNVGTGKSRPVVPDLRLEGVSAGARPVALISGRAVREGGVIEGCRVVRIGRSAVTLAGPAGSRIDLALEDPRSIGGGR